MSKVIFYRCDECDNIIAQIKEGKGTLVCCDKAMKRLDANTTDAVQEKHVPDIKKEDGKIKVTIGSILHPTLPEHYIEWIALVTEDKVQLTYLQPGLEPKAEFEEVEHGTVYEYCNIHGLWKADF
jgi:superoxide reductase